MALDTLKQFLSKEISASRAEDRLLANPMYQKQLEQIGITNEDAFGKLKDNQEQRKLDMFTEDLIKKATESPDFDPNNIDPSSKAILDYAQRNNIDPLQAKEIVKYRQKIPFDLASRQMNNPKYSALMKTIYPELSRNNQSDYDTKGRIDVERVKGEEERKTIGTKLNAELKIIDAQTVREREKQSSILSRQISSAIVEGNIDNAKNLFNSQLNAWEELQRKGTLSPKDALMFAQNAQKTIDLLADRMSGNGWFSTTGAAKEFKNKAQELLDQQKFGELSNLIQGINKDTKAPVPPQLNERGMINIPVLPASPSPDSGGINNNIPSPMANRPKINKGASVSTGVSSNKTVEVSVDGKKYDTGISISEVSKLSPEQRKTLINKKIKEMFEIVE